MHLYGTSLAVDLLNLKIEKLKSVVTIFPGGGVQIHGQHNYDFYYTEIHVCYMSMYIPTFKFFTSFNIHCTFTEQKTRTTL